MISGDMTSAREVACHKNQRIAMKHRTVTDKHRRQIERNVKGQRDDRIIAKYGTVVLYLNSKKKIELQGSTTEGEV